MAASNQKKKTTTSSSKKSTASGGKRTASKSSSGASKRAPANRKPDYTNRVVGGLVCFALAVFSAFGYFGIEAVLIDLLVNLERGLFGYGYWVTPIMLLWASVILLLHKGMPVRLRTTMALITPVLVGGLAQSILWSDQYQIGLGLFGSLWTSGLEMSSGGALGGWLAAILVTALSKVGAIPVCLILIVVAMFVLTQKTPTDVAHAYRDASDRIQERKAQREAEREAEAMLEPQPPVRRKEPLPVRQKPVSRKAPRRSAIDIPVDDDLEPVYDESVEEPAREEHREKKTDANTAAVPIFKKSDKPLFEEKKGEGFFDKFFTPEPEIEEPARDYRPKVSPTTPKPEVAVNQRGELLEKPEQADIPEDVKIPTPAEKKAAAAREKQEQETVSARVAQELDAGMKTVDEYIHPSVELLGVSEGVSDNAAQGEIKDIGERLDDTIQAFGIDAHVVGAVRGPTVTRYELELERGVKLSRVTNLADDIALTLGAKSVRIAPIPGKSLVVGVEVPNRLISPVPIRQVIDSPEFMDHKSNVAFALGKDISGKNVIGNISKLPHMLIAGTTGSGKSVCTNSIIISLLYKSSPEQVRLIMIDPKMVELSVYNGIPHLLIPVVTDPKKAAGSLQWAVTEMLKRYRLFSERHVRDLESYNQQVEADLDTEDKPLPQIVVFIDELADLMLVASKEVEEAICRLAQMGRASGMHLIIATQRPSTDVITGLMKANIPSRIALSVASSLESRIILDNQGAEKLLGNGDMLFSPVGSGKPLRVQGCYISDEEVASVVEFIKSHSESDYDDSVMKEVEHNAEQAGKGSKKGGSTLPDSTIPEPVSGPSPDDGDPLLNDAIEVVVETQMASVSMLQRRLKLGYARAARLVDQMEEKGIVGPFQGSKPREVLIGKEQWAEMKMQGNAEAGVFDQAKAMSEEADREAMAEEVDLPPFEV